MSMTDQHYASAQVDDLKHQVAVWKQECVVLKGRNIAYADIIRTLLGEYAEALLYVEDRQHKDPCVCTRNMMTGRITDPDCFR